MAKKYNEIEVKDNMKVNESTEETEKVSDKKQMESVVSVQPTKVKRSLFGRLVTGVVGPEGLPGIGSYVNEEIVKPAIKNIIVDAVTSGINMVMYGERGGVSRGRQAPYSSGSRQPAYRPNTNYGSNYRTAPISNGAAERTITHAPRPKNGVEEYLIADRVDAATVLANLTDSAERYGTVSVADYYDLIGVPSQYTDNNYGWSVDIIHRATIQPVRGGFVIRFPILEEI